METNRSKTIYRLYVKLSSSIHEYSKPAIAFMYAPQFILKTSKSLPNIVGNTLDEST